MKRCVYSLIALLTILAVAVPLLAPIPAQGGLGGYDGALHDDADPGIPAGYPREKPAQSPDLAPGLWHRVGDGETLRSVANRYYGSPRQWRTLQIANNAPARPPVDSLLWIPGLRDEMDDLGELPDSALSALE